MENNWAIIVGINHYDHHPDRNLKYAVQDAQLMRDFLCNHALFPEENVVLCLGEEPYRGSLTYPTYANLLRLLDTDVHIQREKVDRFWFFFGGHGTSRNGRDYLLTSDSLVKDIDIKIALPVDEVIACLRQHNDADIVLILDSCRELKGTRSFGNAMGQETVELAHQRRITTIFSCDYGQYSYEPSNLQHGVFTYALVEGLKQYTLPSQLECYLQQRVRQLSHVDQSPRIRVEPASNINRPLLPGCATASDMEALVNLAKEEELEDNFEDAEETWWQIIHSSPSRTLKEEARKRIDRIQQKKRQLDVSTPNLPTEPGLASASRGRQNFVVEPIPKTEPAVLQLPETQSSEKDKIASDLINYLFDALSSSSFEIALREFKAIAHASLFLKGEIKPDFLKNNFNQAVQRARLYERPIQIINKQSTQRTQIVRGEHGEEIIYTISCNKSKGSVGHIRIFFPINNNAAKISKLDL